MFPYRNHFELLNVAEKECPLERYAKEQEALLVNKTWITESANQFPGKRFPRFRDPDWKFRPVDIVMLKYKQVRVFIVQRSDLILYRTYRLF